MRKIRITESQWKKIIESELGYPLSLDSANEEPDNFMGTQVAVNNVDPDAPDDVSTSELLGKRPRASWFGIRSVHNVCRMEEGEELDNVEVSGFGVNADKMINNVAKNGGGKMAVNISAEVNSDKEGSRNNTNQVRISRMEEYRETNPELFQKNGGEKMLSTLKSQVKKTSDAHNTVHANDVRKQKNSPQNNGVYYFS